MRNYESAAICVLSLTLLLVSSILEASFKTQIPTAFEMTIYAAKILGEINQSYVPIPGWDTMLHTINGFLRANEKIPDFSLWRIFDFTP